MKTINLSILTIVLVSCISEAGEIVINPGECIRHDDFDYLVTSYVVTKQVGTRQDSSAEKKFYLVNFEVINNAVRVDHKWDNAVAYLIDEQRNTYENQPSLQEVLNKLSPFNLKDKYITRPETQDTTIFVFEVPNDVKSPFLMVRGETLMADFFNGNQFRKTKVKLFD